MAFTFRLSPAQRVQAAAVVATLAGIGVWSSLLLTSAESSVPVPDNPVPATRVDTPALQWFSTHPKGVDIKVSGVMAGAHGAVAILSLNDAPPRGFLVGERLSQGIRLVAIERDAVVIERGTEHTRFKVSTLPDGPVLPRLLKP